MYLHRSNLFHKAETNVQRKVGIRSPATAQSLAIVVVAIRVIASVASVATVATIAAVATERPVVTSIRISEAGHSALEGTLSSAEKVAQEEPVLALSLPALGRLGLGEGHAQAHDGQDHCQLDHVT